MQEDDLRALAKIIDFFRAAAVVLLILHCYWFCFEIFYKWGIYNDIVNNILAKMAVTGLFDDIMTSKVYCFILLVISCLGTRATKSRTIRIGHVLCLATIGILLFFCNTSLLNVSDAPWYILTCVLGFIAILTAGSWAGKLFNNNLMRDVFNSENESFMQETKKMENEYSVNLPTKFWYQKRSHDGWINIVNPFRATIVLGTPGSGKSYAIVNQMIKQHIEKGFAMFVYDFKYPDLSTITYNHLVHHLEGYGIKPKFYVINFDNPKHSHRCNPINPEFMTDISDAYESAYTIMLNLNKTWV